MPETLNILSKLMQLIRAEYRIKLIPKFLFHPATLGFLYRLHIKTVLTENLHSKGIGSVTRSLKLLRYPLYTTMRVDGILERSPMASS